MTKRRMISAVLVLLGAWVGTAAIINMILFGKTDLMVVIIAVSVFAVFTGEWIGRRWTRDEM